MKKVMVLLPTIFIVVSILLSSCNLLIPLEDEPVTGDFGPSYTAKEHQTRTFETLWKNIADSYVYFDNSDVNWNQMHD